MSESDVLVHSQNLLPEQSGELLDLPRQAAHWEWMSFFARRLAAGDVYRTQTEREAAAVVLLGGTCVADWGKGGEGIGKRRNVFDGLPYALYLPCRNRVAFTTKTTCEIA